jgi:hypothetical protein
MRKILVLILVLTAAFVSLASANQLGFGYNNGGPALRFKWDDSIVSELSAIVNYYNSTASISNNVTLCISPINLTLYKGALGEVSVGFRLKDTLVYSEAVLNNVKVKKFTANSYGLDIMLPELELNVPGVDGLKLIGSVGISSGWQYDNNGKLQSFNMGLYGISLASAGIVYYFNLGGGQAAKSGQVYSAPAPIAPVKDNTVK